MTPAEGSAGSPAGGSAGSPAAGSSEDGGDGGVFAGAVDYYARYRPNFPVAVYEAIVETFQLDGRGRLLDLGTGTGHIALTLGEHFESTVGVDPSDEMLAIARRESGHLPRREVEWRLGRAEDLDLPGGSVRLVTIGNALHWMDRDVVLPRCLELLAPGGGIALIGMPGMWAPTMELGSESWLHALRAVVERHLGDQRRAGDGYYHPDHERFEDALATRGFASISTGTAALDLTWTVDDVIGYLYSTSFANRSILGDRVEAFERDLRATLAATEPSGQFHRRLDATWAFGHRPS